jgi:hypothetical protein
MNPGTRRRPSPAKREYLPAFLASHSPITTPVTGATCSGNAVTTDAGRDAEHKSEQLQPVDEGPVRGAAAENPRLLYLLPQHISDAINHNIRVALLAGLAEGFGKVLLLLQDGDEPIPLDYRDLVTVFMQASDIDEPISEFATRVTEAMQRPSYQEIDKRHSLLEDLS